MKVSAALAPGTASVTVTAARCDRGSVAAKARIQMTVVTGTEPGDDPIRRERACGPFR